MHLPTTSGSARLPFVVKNTYGNSLMYLACFTALASNSGSVNDSPRKKSPSSSTPASRISAVNLVNNPQDMGCVGCFSLILKAQKPQRKLQEPVSSIFTDFGAGGAVIRCDSGILVIASILSVIMRRAPGSSPAPSVVLSCAPISIPAIHRENRPVVNQVGITSEVLALMPKHTSAIKAHAFAVAARSSTRQALSNS